MKIIRMSCKALPSSLPDSVCCIGYFDGMHPGHQALVEKAVQLAKENHLVPGLITFDPDPWVIFKPESNFSHLTSLEDKEEAARRQGIEIFYILDFTREFAALLTDAFHALLADMHVKKLVCGFDFHYGAGNAGSIDTLQNQEHFDVEVISPVVYGMETEKISSSRIEALIEAGQVEKAAWLLGRYYSIEGSIVHGYRRGTTLLQFPTANLELFDKYVLPADGVYFGFVYVKKEYWPAMINIGTNPTFENRRVTIEAHIFDFHEDIYHVHARFFFCRRIRPVQKFSSIDELKAQLQKDAAICRAWIEQECFDKQDCGFFEKVQNN